MSEEQKKKPALSSRLLSMKFMRKAEEQAKLKEAIDRAQANQDVEMKDEDATIADDAKVEDIKEEVTGIKTEPGTSQSQPSTSKPSTGCKIIYEAAPLPGLIGGRLRFGPKPIEVAEQQRQEVEEEEPPTISEAAAEEETEQIQRGQGLSNSLPSSLQQHAQHSQKPVKPAPRQQRHQGMDISDDQMALSLQQSRGNQGHNKNKQQQKRPPSNPFTSLREMKRAKR